MTSTWARDRVDRRDLGRWSFELRDDEIADLAYRGRPVLRSIRAVVRDRDWATAPWRIVDIETGDDHGHVDHGGDDHGGDGWLALRLRSDAWGADVSASVRVAAAGDEIAVTFEAVPAHDLDTNRTGLVVLHPPQVAGTPLLVTHGAESAEGAREATVFPLAISPHQPVVDVTGLTWQPGDLTVDLRLTGDVFEMEDQRNWTDASFKTYSRPLSLPFPYRLPAGAPVRQALTLRAAVAPGADGSDAAVPSPATIVLHPGGVFPRIGVGAASAPDPAPAFAVIGQEVLVELDLASPNWQAALERAGSAGLPLDVRIVLGADSGRDDGGGGSTALDALDAVARALRGREIVRVAAFQPAGDARHVSDLAATAALRRALRSAGLAAPVVGGARSHFTELNRERHRLPGDLDGIAVATTPLFHALGTEQLVEAVAMQRIVAAQTVGIAGGIPVHIGPVCLRPRFNDVATEPPPLPERTDLSQGYGAEFTGASDPRQSAAELAAWTVASAAALAVPGVASLAWFEEWGPRGIRSAGGTPFPVAGAVAELVRLAGAPGADGAPGAELLSGDSPDGLVWAIGARTPGGDAVLVANLDRVARTVRIEVAGRPAVETSLAAGSFARRELGPPS